MIIENVMLDFYMIFKHARTGLYAFLAILFIFAIQAPAHALDMNAFTVRDVKIDVTAENANIAREQAFGQAQQKAFAKLAQQIMPEEDFTHFQPPQTSLISTMVQDFEITSEKLSHVRYIGTYTFRFKEDAVRRHLSGQGVTYSDVKSRPVLVLPFYEWGSRTVLWGPDNPLLTAWSRSQPTNGLVPVIAPIGDLLDVSDVSDDDVLTYNIDALDSMAKRYNAGQTIIALAAPLWEENTENASMRPTALNIMMYRTNSATPELITTLKIKAEESDSADILFDKAVKEISATIQKNWKTQTAITQDTSSSSLQATVRFHNMREWVETQKALRRVQGISDIDLLSLKPAQANVKITFRGSENRLRLALSQSGITLSEPQVTFNRLTATSPLEYELFLNKYR